MANAVPAARRRSAGTREFTGESGTKLPHRLLKRLQRAPIGPYNGCADTTQMQYQPIRPGERGQNAMPGRKAIEKGGTSMKKLLSFLALSCAMVLAFGAFAPRASAAALPTGVVTLKADQTGVVQEARYRCWWRNGYRHCGYSSSRLASSWILASSPLAPSLLAASWLASSRLSAQPPLAASPYLARALLRPSSLLLSALCIRPAYRPVYRYRPYAYCIGLCWW